MFTLMCETRQSERLGQHHRDHGAGAGAQVLAAEEGFDAAVGMDFNQAGRGVPAPLPGVDGHAQSRDDRALLGALTVLVPLGLPIHQLGRDLHLLGVDRRAFLGHVGQVAHEDVVAVQLELGGDVVDGRLRERAALRVVRRPPGALRRGVGFHVRDATPVVGRHDHVGHHVLRQRRAAETAGRPMVRIPDRDQPLAVGADRHVGKTRRPAARVLQLQIAIEHQLHRPAELLGERGGQLVPTVGGELAAEPAADVVAVNGHVVRGDFQLRGELAGRSRHVLCRQVGSKLVVLPVASRAVGLEAHVRDGGDAVVALDDRGGLFEQPLDLFLLELLLVFVLARLILEHHFAAALVGPVRPFRRLPGLPR